MTTTLGASAPTIFTFQNGKPHPVRIYTDADGSPLFHAGDLCDLLEYVNPRQALAQHVEKDDVTKRDVIDRLGRTQQANFVREPGMWSLLLGSHAPNAKKVKRWITAEVLPAIRKTGSYHAVPPAPTFEQITAADHKNLQRVMWMICSRFHWNSSWTSAVWYAIRQVTGCAAPQRFEVRHLPLIATELRRILEISTAVKDHCMEIEKEAIRRIVRNREAAGPFVERLKAEEAGWLNEQKPWHAQLESWHQKDLDALALRQPPYESDHSNYAEPKALQ
jgi:prophage antirepressor-like protein